MKENEGGKKGLKIYPRRHNNRAKKKGLTVRRNTQKDRG